MTCIHLRQLYQLCQSTDLKLSSSDLIHVVCQQCGEQEICPSMMIREEDQETGAEAKAQDAPAGSD